MEAELPFFLLEMKNLNLKIYKINLVSTKAILKTEEIIACTINPDGRINTFQIKLRLVCLGYTIKIVSLLYDDVCKRN
jgi:hypothetical protein